jgi:hypothetical protein
MTEKRLSEALLSVLFSLQLDREHYGVIMRMTQPTGLKKAYAQGQIDELKKVIELIERASSFGDRAENHMKDYTKKHIDFIKPKSQIQCLVAARAINEARIIVGRMARAKSATELDELGNELFELEIALYKQAESRETALRRKRDERKRK